MTTFADWLTQELNQRDMSPADLARAMRKDQGIISRLLRGERNPNPETLTAIARALRLPPETVFRAAGLLPPVSEVDELKADIIDLTAQMSREEQREVLEYLRMKRRLREEREQEKQSVTLGAKVAKQGR
jgi:transcriptional regulator with XRE-family HTH domain